MDHLRHQKYKNKQFKNNTLLLEKCFKPINKSINDVDIFKKKELKMLKKTLSMIGTIG